jgi:hypothetical protein
MSMSHCPSRKPQLSPRLPFHLKKMITKPKHLEQLNRYLEKVVGTGKSSSSHLGLAIVGPNILCK